MKIREVTSTGIEALNLATTLLQRARLADPHQGIFEAADIQWSWRTPRLSDAAEKIFWMDEHGPVAGLLLTSYSDHSWQLDPVIVPGSEAIDALTVWERMNSLIERNPTITFQIPSSNSDTQYTDLANQAGMVAVHQDTTGSLAANERPGVIPFQDGFTLVDRTVRPDTPHPMGDRNGAHIEDRLKQCSLYDPWLDLSIETVDGTIAGYSLYWFDLVTNVGLVEPVRVSDDFQRMGLARAMLTHGIDRLVQRGAQRIKVSWETPAAGALYLGTGFRQESSTTWYSRPAK